MCGEFHPTFRPCPAEMFTVGPRKTRSMFRYFMADVSYRTDARR